MARAASTSEIQNAYAQFAAQSPELGMLAADVEDLGWLFPRLNQEQRREWAAQFHNAAGRLPYVDDCDFGALVLECVADTIVGFGEMKAEVQRFLYTEAIFRAGWCAQFATSGGEGMARSQHLRRLEEKQRILISQCETKGKLKDQGASE